MYIQQEYTSGIAAKLHGQSYRYIQVYAVNMDLVINAIHLCQQGKALTTFLSTKVTLWHYITVLVEFLHGELQAVGILDEQQDERVEHQDRRAIEDRLSWIELGN